MGEPFGYIENQKRGDIAFFDGTAWTRYPAGVTASGGISHSLLSGLTTSDAGHTQFAYLAGRAGGQALQGGSAAGEGLWLVSTSNATRGTIILGASAISGYDDVNNRLGLGVLTPGYRLEVRTGTIAITDGSSDDLLIYRDGATGHYFYDSTQTTFGGHELRIKNITSGALSGGLQVKSWTPAANVTPVYAMEGATPTLRQLKTFDPGNAGVNFTAGQFVCVLV